MILEFYQSQENDKIKNEGLNFRATSEIEVRNDYDRTSYEFIECLDLPNAYE